MTVQFPVLAPSILAADFTRLGQQIDQCVQAGSQWLHCDIMDGHFVPNISFGPGIVRAAAGVADLFIDVHLMIENPDAYIAELADAGAHQVTVHEEACIHLHRTIQKIKEHKLMAGVAVNPATPLSNLDPILPYLNTVLIMSVNPGFGGQDFIEGTYSRLEAMRTRRRQKGLNFWIEVDGGVNPDNISKVTGSGADIVVAGSSVFKSDDIPSQIKELTRLANKGNAKTV